MQKTIPSLNLTAKAPENGCLELEYDRFFLGWPYFQGLLGRVVAGMVSYEQRGFASSHMSEIPKTLTWHSILLIGLWRPSLFPRSVANPYRIYAWVRYFIPYLYIYIIHNQWFWVSSYDSNQRSRLFSVRHFESIAQSPAELGNVPTSTPGTFQRGGSGYLGYVDSNQGYNL